MRREEDKLSQVTPSQRVLLLSHCLRPSQSCPGKFNKEGLQCPADCNVQCVIKDFRLAAAGLGYGGVCIAAGGAMALRFIREHKPHGIVAVACNKELTAGVQEIKELNQDETPAILIVPLSKDGCVDTEVDAEEVLKAIELDSPS